MHPYRARLRALSAQRGALCVGIDPHPHLLQKWGLPADADGVERLARGMVEALGGKVTAFKPQSAFFEAHGSRGIAVLERVLADIRQAGALAVLDAKRGDIGSTMDAYAAATLIPGAPLECDALTVSPYLGFGALRPAIDAAVEHGRGLYVLCRTSNPDGGEVQLAAAADGGTVAQQVIRLAQAVNTETGTDAIGLVIGATRRLDVDLTGFTGSLLVPGVGAQGGRMDELPSIFGPALEHVLPASSRDIMDAGPDARALCDKVDAVLAAGPALAATPAAPNDRLEEEMQ